jgi:Na+/H+ antiporter NhaD/arsenite permease-like protein
MLSLIHRLAHRASRLIARDPVLPAAAAAMLLSVFFVKPDQNYLDYIDARVLICLLALMLAVELFQEARLLAALAGAILNRVGGLRRLSLVLTGLTFVLAMLLTNDVALITLVPLTLLIFRVLDNSAALIRVIVLQTVAANVGSALTPLGNPQNLFLFTHYQMSLTSFWRAVWPVGAAGALLLALLIFRAGDRSVQVKAQNVAVRRDIGLVLAAVLFVLAVVCVFGFLNEWILLGLTLILTATLRPRTLLRVDYGLLLTFVFFFILTGNLSRLPAVHQWFATLLAGQRPVMLAGALLSQLISNVPAALLLAGFTPEAGPLLRGVDVGGCGTLIASLASVISYKIYIRTDPSPLGRKNYLSIFSLYNLGFLAFLTAAALVFAY